jgi:hypothetical protein
MFQITHAIEIKLNNLKLFENNYAIYGETVFVVLTLTATCFNLLLYEFHKDGKFKHRDIKSTFDEEFLLSIILRASTYRGKY